MQPLSTQEDFYRLQLLRMNESGYLNHMNEQDQTISRTFNHPGT